MNNGFFRRVALWPAAAAALLAFARICSAQYPDGIYAEFTTSMGSYTCRLEYAFAPNTVANFIGLATGERSWLDLATGQVKNTPFYNGTTLHRVIAGFVNQGGSPNGLGTDGPGYQFVDEFTPSLRHDGFGVLSSANSGPDSNGSQYFITVSAQPQLDDVHTVFGRLYGGSNVVYAINHVTTGANNKPLTNVVVQSVVIRRIGTAAQEFDVTAQSLPLVTSLNLRIAKAATNVSLTFSNRLYADNRISSSIDLNTWAVSSLGIEVAAPVSNSIVRASSLPREFFRSAQILYPNLLYPPKNVIGKIVNVNFDSGLGTLTMWLTNSTRGTYVYNGSAGAVTNYVWSQEPYNGRLWPIYFSALVPMTIGLNYSSTNSGVVFGTAYSGTPFAISGTFTNN